MAFEISERDALQLVGHFAGPLQSGLLSEQNPSMGKKPKTPDELLNLVAAEMTKRGYATHPTDLFLGDGPQAWSVGSGGQKSIDLKKTEVRDQVARELNADYFVAREVITDAKLRSLILDRGKRLGLTLGPIAVEPSGPPGQEEANWNFPVPAGSEGEANPLVADIESLRHKYDLSVRSAATDHA